MKISRKVFVSSLGSLAIGATGLYLFSGDKKKTVAGKIIGGPANGHKLREGKFPPVTRTESKEVIIVGGGISGLAAARKLNQNNIPFLLLEQSEEPGGNSAGGINEISAYPWGAHYLPVPNLNQPELIEFLKEEGVITGFDSSGKPFYNEEYLCFEPEERLWINHRWQEGIVPASGFTKTDKKDFERFFNLIQDFKTKIGKDNKEAFCIPVNQSSNDPEFNSLDQVSFNQYLKDLGFTSSFLYSYIAYCCKDDYGLLPGKTSAWAGIHYFASRKGIAANAASEDVLTWPEGNGFLAGKLISKISENIRVNSLVWKVEETENGITASCFDSQKNESYKIICKHIILAIPRFVSKRIVKNPPFASELQPSYPWMVANITTKIPDETVGAPLSWDNVLYNGKGLGYVNACHQHLKTNEKIVVLTYYLPLCSGNPADERKKAYELSHSDWVELIFADLEKAHRDIRDKVLSIDIRIWGHAMSGPVPGIITSLKKENLLRYGKRISYAHTDFSGISIFEEAFWQGNTAADQVVELWKAKAL